MASGQIIDEEDPAVVFYRKMTDRPLRSPKFEIEGFGKRRLVNDPFSDFFEATADFPIDSADIRSVAARLM